MRRLFGIAAASLLLLAGRPIRADGSIPTAELLEMLSQSNPKLVQTISNTSGSPSSAVVQTNFYKPAA